MRDSAVKATTNPAGDNLQAVNRIFDRYNNYITTGLLSDLTFVPDGGTPPASGLLPVVNLGRFFLPPQPAFGLLPPAVGAQAEGFVNTVARPALTAMHDAIKAANGAGDFIYMLNWHCDPDLELITGDAESTLRKRLTAAAAANVQVRGMFWGGFALPKVAWFGFVLALADTPATLAPFLLVTYEFLREYVFERPEADVNRKTVKLFEDLKAASHDVEAVSDSNHPLAGTHHQKVLVVKAGSEITAFVGGVEYNSDRLLPAEDPLTKPTGSPLFDTTVKLHQPASRLALRTFVNRWKQLSDAPLLDDGATDPGPSTGPLSVQLTHTSSPGHPFKARVVTAADALSNGILSARNFIYIEDQYFVGSNRQTDALEQALRNQGKLQVVAVIANSDSFTDFNADLLKFKRDEFIRPLVEKFGARFLVFERLGLTPGPTVVPSSIGNSAYVHSKLMIVDDEAAFIGSVNSSRRSWFHDSEVCATIVDMKHGAGPEHPTLGGWVREFRCRVWNEHFQQACTGNPEIDLNTWRELANGTSLIAATALVRPHQVADASIFPASLVGTGEKLLWNSLIDPKSGIFETDPDVVKGAL